jgi:guanylate kinase
MKRGELFILSAPSGAGKTTLIRSLMETGCGGEGLIEFSVSHTTRLPRGGEVDGVDYHFVSDELFERMVVAGEFLEWATVHNRSYGTSLAEVQHRVDSGIDVLLDIDVQGAERVLELYSSPGQWPLQVPVHSIFIMPPSFEDLERRLRSRGLDDQEEIDRRLAVSYDEIRAADKYDYAIINDRAESASRTLNSIIVEKRHRRERIQQRVRAVQEDFRNSRANIRQDGPGQTPEVDSELE